MVSLNTFKARCNGDSWAGKSSWQVDYRVSDLQQDSKVARFWTRNRAIRISEYVDSAAAATGQLHLPLALAERRLSPLQRALSVLSAAKALSTNTCGFVYYFDYHPQFEIPHYG
jgi:hypothetical protein